MSKIGKKAITIPENVVVQIENNQVITTGPKGTLSLSIPRGFVVNQKNNELLVTPIKADDVDKASWGTLRALLNNIIIGVSQGFEKKLEIQGIGYKAEVKGNQIILNIGFCNPVSLEIPEGLEVKVEKNTISISGISKQAVGDFSALVRHQRKINPYSGKGIRYSDEKVIHKVGKKVGGASST